MREQPVALVTGAIQGIGFQIAKDLVAQGFTVLVGSRNLARGAAAARDIGPKAVAIQLDVTDQASVDASANRIRAAFNRLDVLIQNAAIASASDREQTSQELADSGRPSVIPLDEIRTIWDTNVFGVG